jgi:hypothetical protein
MVQEPFPDRGHDGEEPAGSGMPPVGDGGPEANAPQTADQGTEGAGQFVDDSPQGPEQGLFVCLPAEELSLSGFAQDGRADTMAPGPLLAEVVHAVTGEDGAGLAGLADDQLIGIISAARRMESRAA